MDAQQEVPKRKCMWHAERGAILKGPPKPPPQPDTSNSGIIKQINSQPAGTD